MLAVFGLTPFLILFSIIVIGFLVFVTLKSSIVAVQLLLFSILVDSLIPINRNNQGSSVLLVEAILAFTFLISVIKFFWFFEKKYSIPNLTLVWIPFLVWSLAIGLLIAIDPIRVLSFWKNYFSGFFLFTLVYFSINSKNQIRSLLIGIIVWGILLALLEFKVLWELGGFTTGIIGLFLKKNLLTLGWGRSNFLAAFFVLIIPLTIGYFLYTKSKGIKITLIVALILMAFAMILTLSRGGILALLIALIILSFKVINTKTLVPMLSAILLMVIFILLNPLTYVLINSISALETSSSVYSRISFYKDVWNAFLQNPVTGVGFGNLGYYAQFIIPYQAVPSAHNIVLGALGEIGLVGTFLYLAIFFILIKKVYLEYKIENDQRLNVLRWCVFAALLGGIIHSLVEPTFESLQFSIIFWTISGIAVRLESFKSSN
jgi:hypothetical protein